MTVKINTKDGQIELTDEVIAESGVMKTNQDSLCLKLSR